MIQNYVNKLIQNLPNDTKNKETIDVVFDGGAFNGSYLVGAAYFLKSMEERGYIKIKRISACSVGSLISLLYVSNCMNKFEEIYQILMKHFTENYQLDNFHSIYERLESSIPENICQLMTNKVYISFYDLKKNKKIVKYRYKSKKEILDVIYKSCFVPVLTNGNMLHNNRYLDGINPFIFKKEGNRQILFLNLFTYNNLGSLFNIKNEKTNFHRVLSGLLDIHNFYIKKSNTQMCSYVNKWGLFNQGQFAFKKLLEFLIVNSIRMFFYFKKKIPLHIFDNIICKIFSKVMNDVYIILLENYCF